MYLIGKENKVISSKYGKEIKIDLSKVWMVKRTSGCKAGEYALYERDDHEKFTIFAGYITYDSICENFEMINLNKEK